MLAATRPKPGQRQFISSQKVCDGRTGKKFVSQSRVSDLRTG